MSANPINYLEIDAFDRRLGLGMTGWEVAVIRRLDEAVLTFSKAPKTKGPATEVEASDSSAVRGLLRGLGARVSKSKSAPRKPASE
jgi:hypothetical protein